MHISIKAMVTALMLVSSFAAVANAQNEEKPIVLEKKLIIEVANPSSHNRPNEPVCIPLDEIKALAHDFNVEFYRVKHPSGGFEPLDIPTQIVRIPGELAPSEELVFMLDLKAGAHETVELWYTPEGNERMTYPAETQSFAKWYHLGSNIAWENREIAYRSYSGIVDYFAKSYKHLRLHNLPPDSYHHERFWGLDPYMVGTKPGLCGVMLETKAGMQPCYGDSASTGLTYTHLAIEGGPVCAGAVVQVRLDGKLLCENIYRLYAGRAENRVTTVVAEDMRRELGEVYVGMQSYEAPAITDNRGLLSYVGSPVEEYGLIYTGLVYDDSRADGTIDINDGVFVELRPDSDGAVRYASVARWSRVSAELPDNEGAFLSYLERLREIFNNPIKYSLSFGR